MNGQIQCRPSPLLWVTSRRADPFFNTPAAIAAALTSGEYKLVIIDGGAVGPDSATITAGLTSGAYLPAIVEADPSEQPAAITAALTSGEYKLVIIDGGTIGPDPAAVSAALTGGAYTLVIIATTAPTNAANLTANLSSGSYALA